MREKVRPGHFPVVTDHINLMGRNPLRAFHEEELGTMFPDMTQAYDPRLSKAILAICKKRKVPAHSGVYVAVGSPETVRQRLEDYAQRVGFGLLVANFSVGNVPTELTKKSMTVFAQEVMPRLKHVNSDAPVAAGAVG